MRKSSSRTQAGMVDCSWGSAKARSVLAALLQLGWSISGNRVLIAHRAAVPRRRNRGVAKDRFHLHLSGVLVRRGKGCQKSLSGHWW